MGLNEDSEFLKIGSETDPQNFLHEKYQLFHKGLKVEFATYMLHSQKDKVTSMNREFYRLGSTMTAPKLSADQALENALRQIGAKSYLWENTQEAVLMNYKKPQGELVLLPVSEDSKKTELKLAYKFDIYASEPLSRGDIYIDANTGETLFYNATIKHAHNSVNKTSNSHFLFNKNAATMFAAANADTRYSGAQTIETSLSGSSYILADATRGNGILTYNMQKGTNYSSAVNFTDADNNWTAAEFNSANKDNGALDAHWGAAMTYDYFKNILGRNSYDNAGTAIKSYVHYSSNYNNAYWNGSVMTYGDGSGAGGFDVLTSIDVCAHEIGHGVCSKTANLAYQKESGALNEALSDIWAACVEYFSAPNDTNKDIWLIGEEIDMRSGSVALRSMRNPNARSQPDTYGGSYWINPNCRPTSNNDYCGVHTNSGVLNYWFYLLSVGGNGTNDLGKVFNVNGIGIDKAAQITYRMESAYMTANSTFANARTYGIQSATDLFGANSPEVAVVTNAFYAVGVGAAYIAPDIQAPTAPMNLLADGTTATTTNLTWTSSTDDVAVAGYYIYQDGVQVGSSATNSYLVSGLTSLTAYTFSVKAFDAVGNLSELSNLVEVTTLVAAPYCSSASTNAANDRISKVVIGTINNTSTGTTGYEDFTSIIANVNTGTAYVITINPIISSAKKKFGYAVFADYNQDGDFADAGETVFTKSATNATSVSGTFTIPSTATAGTTRMRVSMKLSGVPTACETFSEGQVEDYNLNVIIPGAITSSSFARVSNDETTFELYPNPVENYLKVTYRGSENTPYVIFNQMGQEVQKGQMNGGIDVTSFSNGIYFLKMEIDNNVYLRKFIKK